MVGLKGPRGQGWQGYRPIRVLIILTREEHYNEHGKTWLACALVHKACREGYTVLYLRLPRLLQELPIAKGDGRYPKLMASLAKTALPDNSTLLDVPALVQSDGNGFAF